MRIAPLLSLTLATCALTACGGGSDQPTAPPLVATPPPPPRFSGSYSGISTFNVSGQAEVRPSTRVTVTHNGSTIAFGDLNLTVLGTTIVFPLGQGTQASSTAPFVGTHAYNSQGCGVSAVRTETRFAGNLMNLQATITSALCAQSRIAAELSR
jgi:hypothetical protein